MRAAPQAGWKGHWCQQLHSCPPKSQELHQGNAGGLSLGPPRSSRDHHPLFKELEQAVLLHCSHGNAGMERGSLPPGNSVGAGCWGAWVCCGHSCFSEDGGALRRWGLGRGLRRCWGPPPPPRWQGDGTAGPWAGEPAAPQEVQSQARLCIACAREPGACRGASPVFEPSVRRAQAGHQYGQGGPRPCPPLPSLLQAPNLQAQQRGKVLPRGPWDQGATPGTLFHPSLLCPRLCSSVGSWHCCSCTTDNQTLRWGPHRREGDEAGDSRQVASGCQPSRRCPAGHSMAEKPGPAVHPAEKPLIHRKCNPALITRPAAALVTPRAGSGHTAGADSSLLESWCQGSRGRAALRGGFGSARDHHQRMRHLRAHPGGELPAIPAFP